MALTAEQEKRREALGNPDTQTQSSLSEDQQKRRAQLELDSGIRTDIDVAPPTKEELQEGVTTGRALKHALTGIPTGVGETLDMPKTVSDMYRGAAEWGINKIPGVDNYELPSQVPFFGILNPLLNEYPATTDYLKMLPFGEEIAEYTRPELTEEEIAASPLAKTGDVARTGATWFQPGSKAQLVDNAIMSSLAMVGDYVDDSGIGETIGGIVGALVSLIKGKPAKLSKEDAAALQLLKENLTDGETMDEVLVAAEKAIASGEVGTLGDFARNRGIMKVEQTQAPYDQDYANILTDNVVERANKVSDEVTIPFRRTQAADAEAGVEEVVIPMRPLQDTEGVPTADPSVDAARRDLELRRKQIEQAMDEDIVASQEASAAREQEIVGQIDEVAAREVPSADPALELAEQKAKAAALSAGETKAAAKARAEADAALVPLQYRQIVDQVPVTEQAKAFPEGEYPTPAAAQEKADDWWINEAFQEVKSRPEKFKIDKDTIKRIDSVLNMEGIRVEFENYLSKVVEATRRVKGKDGPNTKADFIDEETGALDVDGYIERVMEGEISGAEIMALRNYFAGTDVGNLVKGELDKTIIAQLPDADAAKFQEQLRIYPQHLTQKALADQNPVYLEQGVGTPEQRTAAGKKFGRPGGEADIEAYQNIKQTEAGLQQATAAENAAVAEAKAANTAAGRAQRLESTTGAAKERERVRLEKAQAAEQKSQTRLEKATKSQAGKDIAEINADIRGQYAQKPSVTLKKIMGAEDGAPKLKALYESMTDLGQRESFRMEVGRAMLDTIKDSSGRVLPKSNTGAHKFNELRNTLYDSGILSGAELEEISKSIDQLAVEMLRKQVSGTVKRATDTDINEFGSAAIAALAVNLAPGSSTSLIMGGTIRKIINKHLKQMAQPEKILESVRQITGDPQKFVDAMQKADTEKEAIEIFQQLWFGGVVAGQTIPSEETE